MEPRDKRRYFDELAPVWDELPKPEDDRWKVERFLTQALSGAPARVLDLGCGTGVLVQELLRRCPPGARIVELDFSWAMLRQNAARHDDVRIWRVCAASDRLPFPAGCFDHLLCFNVVPHLGDPREALPPLLPALAPGGALAIGHWMSSDELNAFHARLEGPVSSDRLPPVRELVALTEALGLRVERAEEAPGWYFLRCVKVGRTR